MNLYSTDSSIADYLTLSRLVVWLLMLTSPHHLQLGQSFWPFFGAQWFTRSRVFWANETRQNQPLSARGLLPTTEWNKLSWKKYLIWVTHGSQDHRASVTLSRRSFSTTTIQTAGLFSYETPCSMINWAMQLRQNKFLSVFWNASNYCPIAHQILSDHPAPAADWSPVSLQASFGDNKNAREQRKMTRHHIRALNIFPPWQ